MFFFFIHSTDNEGKKLLQRLSKINRPLEISFKEMAQLMNQCEIVDKQSYAKREQENAGQISDSNGASVASIFPQNNPFSLFSGIIPG